MPLTMQIDPTLRALADQTRLRIMRLLAHMELAVGELAQVLGQSQPRVSRHVRILCDAGLAERRKEGSWVFLKTAIRESAATAAGSRDRAAAGGGGARRSGICRKMQRGSPPLSGDPGRARDHRRVLLPRATPPSGIRSARCTAPMLRSRKR